LTVQFRATPSGGVPPYSFQWFFGDGGSSTDQNPSYTYQKPGNYSWSLDAHDSSGAGVIALGTITVTSGQSSIYLESLQDNGATKNLGYIIFDSSTYSLPVTILKDPTKYEATYKPSVSSSFLKWETTGDVSVLDANKETTTVTVSGTGTLRAIYKSSLPDVYLESLQDDSATKNLGSITFDKTTYALPTDIFKDLSMYEATYNPEAGSSFVKWETSGDVLASDSGSQTTKVDVKGSGSLRAIYKSGQPPSPVIHLESIQDNGLTLDRGSVTFDAVTYSLPGDVSKDPKEYEARYNPSVSTSFVRWETTGDVSVSDPNSESTKVTVKGSGTLTAMYTSGQSYDPPVGGKLMFVNKFAILAPYLALGGLIGVGSALYIMRRRRYSRCKTG
jgi:PKD repeat protein